MGSWACHELLACAIQSKVRYFRSDPFQGKRIFLLCMVNFSRLHYNLACCTRRKRNNCERVRKIRSFSPPFSRSSPPHYSPLGAPSLAHLLARLFDLSAWLWKGLWSPLPTADQRERLEKLWSMLLDHAGIACLFSCLIVSSHANYVFTNFYDLWFLWKKYFNESSEYLPKGM